MRSGKTIAMVDKALEYAYKHPNKVVCVVGILADSSLELVLKDRLAAMGNSHMHVTKAINIVYRPQEFIDGGLE